MEALTLTLETFQRATAVVHRYLQPTLLHCWPLLAERLGCEFHLKHENHQPVGAFKVRGGVHLMSKVEEADRRRGVISCSTGNHGQSVAYAAREFSVPCTIVVPRDNNPGKNASMQSRRVQVVLFCRPQLLPFSRGSQSTWTSAPWHCSYGP